MKRSLRELEKLFESFNLNLNTVGFHISQNFLRAEQQGKLTLEDYAQYVLKKKYSDEYKESAKVTIEKVAEVMIENVLEDHRNGLCIDASLMMSLILDKLGIWNFLVKGSLTIDSKTNEFDSKHFYDIDYNNGHIDSPHAWLVVPPYGIIDLTIKRQSYGDGVESHLPTIIMKEDKELKNYNALPMDLINPMLRNDKSIVDQEMKKVRKCNSIFKAKQFDLNNVRFKYIPVGIGLPDSTFEECTIPLNEKTIVDLWEEVYDSL